MRRGRKQRGETWVPYSTISCGCYTIRHFVTAKGFSIAALANTSSVEVLESFTSPASQLLQLPSSTLSYRKYEASDNIKLWFQENASGVSYSQSATDILIACQAMVVRGCNEFDGDYLDALHKLIDKPAIPVGLLLPPETTTSSSNASQTIFKWLDEQKPLSVLFVGFGSDIRLTKTQLDEIAYGIELYGHPFIWILQKLSWCSDDVDPLPEGFRKRTMEKGVVHIGWAPQKDILAHPSIGGSLNQAGLGSIVETLQHGHVVVALPFMYDQGLNARLLSEKGLGIEVERNEEDGSFTRYEIAKALIYAMVSEEGEHIRAGAREAVAFVGDRKLHDSYIANFVEYLKSNK